MMVMGFEYTYGPLISSLNDLPRNYSNVKFYPNPLSQSTLMVMRDGKVGNYELKLYDVFGKEVAVYRIHNSNSFKLNRGNLSSGIYLYKVTNENNVSVGSGKIVIAE